MSLPNVSSDLIWEVVRTQNAFLVKRKDNGGTHFSRDPLNLTNVHTRTHAGFVNEKAVGIVPHPEGGVKVTTKASAGNKPAASHVQAVHGASKSARKTYRSVANATARFGYRADLRAAAVARVSAIRRAQREVKADFEVKLRGAKARKAAAESA